MSTADKLSKLLETKKAIKTAIIEKGVEAGDVFATYPEKIKAIETGGTGSSGDKVWAVKGFGAPKNKGDKVFIRKNLKGDLKLNTDFSDPSATSAYCKNDGSVIAHLTSDNFMLYDLAYGTTYSDGLLLGKPTVNRQYHRTKRFGDKVVFYADADVSDGATYDIIVGKTSIVEIYGKLLREDLVLQYVSDNNFKLKRYDIDTNTYGEDLGSIDISDGSNVYYIADVVLDGNILLVTKRKKQYTGDDWSYFYDVSDLYNPILLNKTKMISLPKIYCATGLRIGEYIITRGSAHLDTFTKDTTHIYQIKENYTLGSADDINDEIVYLLSGVSTVCYNDENKILSIGGNFFKYEDGKFNRIEIGYGMVTMNVTTLPVAFILSENLETSARIFTYRSSSSNVKRLNVYRQADLDANWVTTSDMVSNVFTGIYTGRTDAYNRVEVESILPAKVNLTVVTDVDVSDDEIIFEGVA